MTVTKQGRMIDGPVAGVAYRSPSRAGVTDADGRFEYADGEDVTFSIGAVALGTVRGTETVTPVELAAGPGAPITDQRVTNLARLLHSLAPAADTDLASGIVVDDRVRAAFDTGVATGLDLSLDDDAFAASDAVRRLVEDLGLRLRTAAEARNHLRRTGQGIKKLTDVAVPARDGAALKADVFRPLDGGRHPVIVRMGVYGRAFEAGSICDEASRLASEGREDDWFEKDRSHLPALRRYSETAVSPNASDWVPRGYVCVRVDARGTDRTAGVISPFSVQEAQDFYDAIEWAAVQPWSNGDVGVFGGSYQGTNVWTVATMKPPSLRAIIPWSADADAYRELSHTGGILLRAVRENWLNTLVIANNCPGAEVAPFVELLEAHSFDDPAHYGPSGDTICGGDPAQVELPFLTSLCMTAAIHSRCGAEAMLVSPSAHKQLVVTDANYWSYMYEDCLDLQVAFFERFLKRAPAAPVPGPAVRVALRTGHGGFEWRDDDRWPLTGTVYREFFLDAGGLAPALGDEAPVGTGVARYSADVMGGDAPLGHSFVSGPLAQDLELAGHFSATLWVSATVADMDVFVAVRVLDEAGEEVRYALRDPASPAAVTWGCLRVSHRALDPDRSNVHRPWHLHTEASLAPLTSPDEVVALEVELLPATARIPAGHRIRLDVQSVAFEAAATAAGRVPDLPGTWNGRVYDRAIHDGAENRIHTGGPHPSRLRIPVVPRLPGVPRR